MSFSKNAFRKKTWVTQVFGAQSGTPDQPDQPGINFFNKNLGDPSFFFDAFLENSPAAQNLGDPKSYGAGSGARRLSSSRATLGGTAFPTSLRASMMSSGHL